MDDLANELSCTMIDVDSEKARGNNNGGGNANQQASNGGEQQATGLRCEAICGGEASAEGDGGAHDTTKYREKVPLKKEDRERQVKDQLQQQMAVENDMISELMGSACTYANYGRSNSLKGSTKPVARSASILLRSRCLILNDSESEEEDSLIGASTGQLITAVRDVNAHFELYVQVSMMLAMHRTADRESYRPEHRAYDAKR